MLGLSVPMWKALRSAPDKWTSVPEPFEHLPATLQALEDRHFIHYRIGDDGFFQWRSSSSGRCLREADRKLKAT